MKKTMAGMFLAGVSLVGMPFAGHLMAAETNSPAVQQAQQTAYLGVAIRPVPPVVVAHLPSSVSRGQGLLVEQVQPGSPADKAGVQPYDVLLNLGDQKLYGPRQLMELVRAGKVGDQVELGVARNDKLITLKVTLEARQAPLAAAPMPRHQELHGPQHHHRAPGGGQAGVMETFDALSMTRTGDGRYKVEVEYLAKDGTKKKHSFEGTEDEVRSLIQQEKDLPDVERRQLLQALELQGAPFGGMLPPWVDPRFFVPFGPGRF